jgi:hypothetical protein
MDLVQQVRDREALGSQRFINDTANEDDPEALRSITVMPYDRFNGVPVAPPLWERYGVNGGREAVTLLLALVFRCGDLAHRPLYYDDRLLYFHFLWDATVGCCEVLENDTLSTYWCADLADFLSQLFDEGLDAVVDKE